MFQMLCGSAPGWNFHNSNIWSDLWLQDGCDEMRWEDVWLWKSMWKDHSAVFYVPRWAQNFGWSAGNRPTGQELFWDIHSNQKQSKMPDIYKSDIDAARQVLTLFSDRAKDFLQKVLAVHAEDRISLQEMLRDPWFYPPMRDDKDNILQEILGFLGLDDWQLLDRVGDVPSVITISKVCPSPSCFKNDINGVYYRQPNTHEGRHWWKKASDLDTWHIRWCPQPYDESDIGRWWIDHGAVTTENRGYIRLDMDLQVPIPDFIERRREPKTHDRRPHNTKRFQYTTGREQWSGWKNGIEVNADISDLRYLERQRCVRVPLEAAIFRAGGPSPQIFMPEDAGRELKRAPSLREKFSESGVCFEPSSDHGLDDSKDDELSDHKCQESRRIKDSLESKATTFWPGSSFWCDTSHLLQEEATIIKRAMAGDMQRWFWCDARQLLPQQANIIRQAMRGMTQRETLPDSSHNGSFWWDASHLPPEQANTIQQVFEGMVGVAWQFPCAPGE